MCVFGGGGGGGNRMKDTEGGGNSMKDTVLDLLSAYLCCPCLFDYNISRKVQERGRVTRCFYLKKVTLQGLDYGSA